MFPPSQHKQGQKDADAPIRLTDTDAALARLSAVQKGYLYDPYVKHVVSRAHLQPPRSPLINVGTFVRSAAIDGLVDGWLQLSEHEGQLCQIVSLGAGSDTRFWRIAVRIQNLFVTPSLATKETYKLSARQVHIRIDWQSTLRSTSQKLLQRKQWRYAKARSLVQFWVTPK